MKYGDLIRFDPIQTVVQLRSAGEEEAARELVESFVISQEMAERLVQLVIPQLQFDRPADNKGLLVVGNYGTGKSHLMAVISAVAENSALAASLRNPEVAAAAKAGIAGRFQVVRTEIGSTEMPLRDILTGRLTERLAELDVHYPFPAADQVPDNKRCFEDLMREFHERFPDQGLLLVVDELLDFLRTRRDQQLILDLNFLREIGEVCASLRFRFLAGVQEAIFDSQRFAFMADSVRRVKDRFEQVLISRTDVQYVVEERLLRKTPEQRERIREHLAPFGRFYERMTEAMEDYVRLFPVHPDYISTFERIASAEKREVLRTLSLAMEELLDEDVPDGEPGLIAYDGYWETLRGNPAFRTKPEIREVIGASDVLESRVRNAGRADHLSLALRIIHGLSVHRLTTGDIHAPLGATAGELRDSLCLYKPGVEDMGDEPAEDLLSQVQSALRDIHQTVSGQFLSSNPANGQYYLDLKKTVDFDALIEERAHSLDPSQLDRHYYQALRELMDLREEHTHIPDYLIWEYELIWRERNASRPGYLFFGAPNERSTAAPPREFYLYFLQPFEPPRYQDEEKADEVFFTWSKDAEFKEVLETYAAAASLKSGSAGLQKKTYAEKASESLKKLRELLQARYLDGFLVTHGGRRRTLREWVQGKSLRELAGIGRQERISFPDVMKTVAAVCLAPHFHDTAPHYPKFEVLLTRENRAQAARDALAAVAGGGRSPSRQAERVLDGLQLRDGQALRPDRSPYARRVLEALGAKAPGQVVGRGELVRDWRGGEYLDPEGQRLETELLVVVLAALVHSGDIVLSAANRTFDALGIADLAAAPLDHLTRFRHVARPKDWNLPGLTALFELLGHAPGLANLLTQGKNEAVQQLQTAVSERVERLAEALHALGQGVRLGDESLLDEADSARLRESLTDAKGFLEETQAFTTPGKFKNFAPSAAEVESRSAGLQAAGEIGLLRSRTGPLEPLVSYLARAQDNLPPEDALIREIAEARRAILEDLRRPERRSEHAAWREAERRLNEVRNRYAEKYRALHRKARLDAPGEARRRRLVQDKRLRSLAAFGDIPLLPRQQLRDFEAAVDSLPACTKLTTEMLRQMPVCAGCDFRPRDASGPSADARLENLMEELDRITRTWSRTLLENLLDPATARSVQLLPPAPRQQIESFVAELQIAPELPSDPAPALIEALREALSKLERVPIPADRLREALLPGGAPARPDEMKTRFDTLLDDLTKGRDPSRVRIVME